MKLVIYGLTLTSSWGNGHATTYRSLCRALARRGHTIHFVEQDVEWYRSNRDLPEPDFATVHLYTDWATEHSRLLELSRDADVTLVGSFFPDSIAATRALADRAAQPILFYDIDTPITVAELRRSGRTPYLDAALIPAYSAYLSFTGGPTLRELEQRFGARRALPFYCSVDPDLYHPTPVDPALASDLSYLGTYAADRQAALERLFVEPARLLPGERFVIGGAQYPDGFPWTPNTFFVRHLPPPEHPAFYSSSRLTLNITREAMARMGWCPSGRLFEAAACGVPILSDWFAGLDEFFQPGEEILVAHTTHDALEALAMDDAALARLAARARARAIEEHSAARRAGEMVAAFEAATSRVPV